MPTRSRRHPPRRTTRTTATTGRRTTTRAPGTRPLRAWSPTSPSQWKTARPTSTFECKSGTTDGEAVKRRSTPTEETHAGLWAKLAGGRAGGDQVWITGRESPMQPFHSGTCLSAAL